MSILHTSTAPHKEMILKVVTAFFPEATVYLFGSYARGEQRDGSDIDIAVDIGREMSLRERGTIFNLCEALPIPQKVDVIDMHMISEEMRSKIVNRGILWKA